MTASGWRSISEERASSRLTAAYAAILRGQFRRPPGFPVRESRYRSWGYGISDGSSVARRRVVYAVSVGTGDPSALQSKR